MPEQRTPEREPVPSDGLVGVSPDGAMQGQSMSSEEGVVRRSASEACLQAYRRRAQSRGASLGR